MKQPAILALDAGQTGIRALLISGGTRTESSFPGLRTDLELFPQLAEVINKVATDSPVHLAIGMTGLTKSQSKPQDLLKSVNSNVVAIDLAHDSITGFLGSIGLHQGTVTAVGTGVVTLAVGPKELVRVDGWGNLIGDAGSAYWIGRAGLEAGMRAYDGRIEKTALIDLLYENFTHPEEAYIELQTNANRVAVIASFAKRILELAETDATAKEIVLEAAEELALSAVTAARRAGTLDSSNPRFSWAGNMMKSTLLKDALIENISSKVPNARFHEPLGEPIEGVALIPTLAPDSPLRTLIYSSERQRV